ncbi:MAG TPA: ABC transporter permease subunit [Roseiflexaceae bacterium]|nr:ABC transporter permease subunit [Roseiflexaceae bacterium]
MLNLIRAEWFKLTRRPLAWVLLAVFLTLLVLLLATEFLLVGLHDGLFSGGARLALLREEQVAQFRLHLGFPGIFGAVLMHVDGVGGMCAIALAAGALGSEYSWGTLRTQLARQPNRGRYLIAKIAGLLLVLLAGILLALLLGALLALLFSALVSSTSGAAASSLALPLGVLRSLYVLLPYLLVTVASCILGRSVIAGAVGGFLFLVIDGGLGALSFLSSLGGLVRVLLNLIVQPNINTLIVLNSRSFGLEPAVLTRTMDLSTLPSPLQATLVIGAWSALFFAYAYRSLLRRDIGGAA